MIKFAFSAGFSTLLSMFKRSLTACAIVSAICIMVPHASAQEAVRPEVGKPLQAANDLMRAGKFKDALNKVREAERVSGLTAQESYLVNSSMGSAASGAGDSATAIRAFEAVLASGKAPGATQLKIVEALVGMQYSARNYPAAIQMATRYFRDGGGSGQVRTLMIQSYFQSGDFANAAKESLTDIQADEKAGRAPSEEKLQLLANSYLRQKNGNGYIATIEKLLNYYPKKSLWADVVSRLQSKPGFADRLALDVYRLRLATGNLTATNDFMEMSQLALQAGFPSEAKKVVDEGYASGALGKGAEAARHKRLKDLVESRVAENASVIAAGSKAEAEANAARNGDALFTLGYNRFTAGQSSGTGMMEAAIKKGDMKRPEDAKLHLGIALLQSNQKVRGVQMLRSVKGDDGVADMANLWVIFSR